MYDIYNSVLQCVAVQCVAVCYLRSLVFPIMSHESVCMVAHSFCRWRYLCV